MDKHYIEAKDAMKILNMPTTSFYREVEAGNIPFRLKEGKKRGMLFPREAIELHARMQKRAKKKTVHHAFTRSTNADIWTAIENAQRVYGEEDIIPYRKVLEWREINDEMSMTIKEDGRFVGCTTFIPLEERVIHALLHDELRERNIPTSAIKKWTEPHLSVYVASIAIEESGDVDRDKERGAFLLRHSIKWAVTLTQQYDIQNWYAIGATSVGQSILERLGFQEIVSLADGARKGYRLKDLHKSSQLMSKFLAEMEEEGLDLSTHQPSAAFVKATVEDMPAAVALADEVFGGRNTIPVEKRMAWLKKNPDIDYLLKQGDQLVGYLSFVPLRPEMIDALLSRKCFAKDLTADDILPYEPHTPVDLYGMAIGVKPGLSLIKKRHYGERLILGAKNVLLDLAKRGIVIRHIVAHSSQPDGIRLMKHFGFTETPPKTTGLRDFSIDIASSGIPFIREYKEALAIAKELQKRNLALESRT